MQAGLYESRCASSGLNLDARVEAGARRVEVGRRVDQLDGYLLPRSGFRECAAVPRRARMQG